ncbi:MAG: hypothetical protein ACRCUX_10405 [Beijerinckiaceae bacterium]
MIKPIFKSKDIYQPPDTVKRSYVIFAIICLIIIFASQFLAINFIRWGFTKDGLKSWFLGNVILSESLDHYYHADIEKFPYLIATLLLTIAGSIFLLWRAIYAFGEQAQQVSKKLFAFRMASAIFVSGVIFFVMSVNDGTGLYAITRRHSIGRNLTVIASFFGVFFYLWSELLAMAILGRKFWLRKQSGGV